MFLHSVKSCKSPGTVVKRNVARALSSVVYEPPRYDELNVDSWLKMDKDTKEELKEYLNWKMEDRWSEMTPKEQRAIYFISFGRWGPRAKPGSKAAQMQLTGAEIILRGVFSGILFAALAVSVINYREDRKVAENLRVLGEDTTAP
ncbi:LADA_0G15676g1_1 [Lachancea dasiensis]|uniref:LADA_0G15676g1_1 n=1 Tax=Lachancea dasiensis TaxID=1072105 RepID=A0A1G4JWP3_9SACH|nr:LADA_0G15676g1_1 [Lachancea dasiensis]